VWVGFDEPRPVGLASSATALPIWGHFAKSSLGDEIRGDFLRPPDVRSYEIASDSSSIALAGCRNTRSEFFLAGTEPDEVCSDGRGSARVHSPEDRRGLFRWLGDLL